MSETVEEISFGDIGGRPPDGGAGGTANQTPSYTIFSRGWFASKFRGTRPFLVSVGNWFYYTVLFFIPICASICNQNFNGFPARKRKKDEGPEESDFDPGSVHYTCPFFESLKIGKLVPIFVTY